MNNKNISNVQNFENSTSFEQKLEVLISSSDLVDFDDNFSWFASTFKDEDSYYPVDTNSNI